MSPRAAAALLGAALVLAASAIARAGGEPGPAAVDVVRVGDGRSALATGFVVAPGRVVTVAHALGDRTPVVDGRPARVLRADLRSDLALLAVPGLSRARCAAGPACWGRGSIGAVVAGAGGPIRARVLRRIDARLRDARRPALELAAAVAPGDSGAPVIAGGRLAGVVFARSAQRPGIAYAVDASAVRALLSGAGR